MGSMSLYTVTALALYLAYFVCLANGQWGNPPNGGKGFHGPPPPNYEGKEFYKILGVNKDATDEQIKRQYRRLARQHHPDVVAAKVDEPEIAKKPKSKPNKKSQPQDDSPKTAEESREYFQQINEAYNVLSDPSKRKDYDLQMTQEAAYGKGGAGGFPFGGGPNGGGSNLNEDQMRQAYEMFMRNFGSGGGGGGGFDSSRYNVPTEEPADQDAYYEDGGKGSEKNMYRDWQRNQKKKAAEEKRKKASERSSRGPPGGGGGGYSQNPFGGAGFSSVYDAYDTFTNGPKEGGGRRKMAPEGPTSIFSNLFGDLKESDKRASTDKEDPFAQYAADSESNSKDKYSRYYNEYKKRKSNDKGASPTGRAEGGAEENETSSSTAEEEEFTKQFKAFEEYQKLKEKNEKDRRAKARAEEQIRKRKQTFTMEDMFGASSSYENTHAEAPVEDIFGNKKMKKTTKPTPSQPKVEEVDPLEAAYSADYQRNKEAFDPQAAKERKEKQRRAERSQKSSSYVVDDDDDSIRASFKSYGVDDSETGKNIPSTNTFEDLAKGWANVMASQYAATGTVPEGATPAQGVDPQDAANANLRKEEDARRNGMGKSRQKANEKATPKQAPTSKMPTTANGKKTPKEAKKAGAKAEPKGKKGKAKPTSKGNDYSKIPDLKERPSDKEMEDWKEIFSDTPPDKDNFPKEPPPHDDPWWQTVFKDGKGPPPAGVKDEPRMPGKLNGPPPSSKAKKGEVTNKDKEVLKEALSDDFGFSPEAWDTHCAAPEEGQKSRACVIIFSSGTSVKALNDTFGAVARRFPHSSKTFYVTRTSAATVSDFIFDKVRAANPPAASDGLDTVPLAFKDALCGKSYERATLTNAGEFCVVVVSEDGKRVQVVGKQRTTHLDLPPKLRSELDKNEGVISSLRKEKGLAANKQTITNGKEAEAMVYAAVKRGLLSYIDF